MAALLEQEECDLLIKNLPKELNNADKEDLLQYFGAKHVVCMGARGKMKNTAFATFTDQASAKQALGRLHQLEILGYKLVAEFAKKQHKTIASCEKSRLSPKQDDVFLNKDVEMTEEPIKKLETSVTVSEKTSEENKVSTKLGLNYERNRCLNYVYPPPNTAIITNIANALICVPKLYVQVLHLMNKLNLPAPFGIVTPTPPFPNAVGDNIVSSSEESEIESDTESKNKRVKENKKRSGVERKKTKAKRLRVEATQLLQPTQGKLSNSKTTHKDVESAFEKTVGLQQYSTKIKLADTISSIFETAPQIPVTTEKNVTAMEASSSGFGTFAPTEVEEENEGDEDDELHEYDGEFVSLSELRKNKMSKEETKSLSAFKKYDCGEPTCRLYIKNLSKQVEVKDLTRVFGRFINQSSEEEKQSFDVRLMKEGRMKGQAFVSFPDEKSAEKALKETHRYLLFDKPLVVQFARSAKPKD